MENINVTLGIQQDAIEKISELVQGNLKDSISEEVKEDFKDEVIEYVTDYMRDDYDISGQISDWMDYHFDIEDHIRNVNLNDYLDGNDTESEIQKLLEQYSPLSSCTTSQLATKAFKDAIRYFLLKDEELIADIANALSRHNKKALLQEVRENVIEEVKPLIIEEFKGELQAYANALEEEKALHQLRMNNLLMNGLNQ